MATGKASDFQIYQEQFYGGFTEIQQQLSDIFNSNSANAIRLQPVRRRGDYEQESFITEVSSLITRRDTTSVATATDLAVAQDEFVGVKLNRKIGPVANTLDSWRKISENQQTMSFVMGQQIAKAVMVDYVNLGVSAGVASLLGQPTLTHDASTGAGTDTMSHTHLINGLSKMGDAGNRVVAWVMHSKVFYDLMKQSLTDNVFQVAGVTINQGTLATLGKPTIVTDSASLVETSGSSASVYRTLALVSDAVRVQESEERDIISEPVTGLENLVFRIQGEYAYNLRVRGFKWDTTNGGANPTDAAIATSTNWDLAASDTRSGPGSLIITD